MVFFKILFILIICLAIFIYIFNYIISRESTILKIINFVLKQDLSKPEVINILNSISNVITESIQYNLLRYNVTGNSKFLEEINSILKYSEKNQIKASIIELIKKYDV